MSTSTNPQSPGGTSVENGVETVTVTASRLPDWKRIALALAIALFVYKLLTQ